MRARLVGVVVVTCHICSRKRWARYNYTTAQLCATWVTDLVEPIDGELEQQSKSAFVLLGESEAIVHEQVWQVETTTSQSTRSMNQEPDTNCLGPPSQQTRFSRLVGGVPGLVVWRRFCKTTDISTRAAHQMASQRRKVTYLSPEEMKVGKVLFLIREKSQWRRTKAPAKEPQPTVATMSCRRTHEYSSVLTRVHVVRRDRVRSGVEDVQEDVFLVLPRSACRA